MIRWVWAAALAGVVMASTDSAAEPVHTILEFDQLDGWAADDHAAALDVFTNTCQDFKDPDWLNLCAAAKTFGPETARSLFRTVFSACAD